MILISKVLRVLDEDHFGLEKIKERIIEHLAVLKLNPKANAPILCFVGPPGVGKTSLGQSIARSLGRRFERISLGGLHDESELRGHRRTYIGCHAWPYHSVDPPCGRQQSSSDARRNRQARAGLPRRSNGGAVGGPRPCSKSTFRDNYLDMPFDLSKVFFIATANALDVIPPARSWIAWRFFASRVTAKTRKHRSQRAT